MSQRHKALGFLGLVLILVAGSIFLAAVHRDISRLPYPPGLDQDAYLEQGRNFVEHGVVTWRTPIYSIWMGGFYVLSSKNLESTFWSEKFVSVALFAVLSAWLGWNIFGTPGLLMGLWALTTKYLVLETNGTHALATSVAMCGALCLFLPWKKLRLPASTLFLFLSTQVRQDMWAPYLTFCGLLAILFLRNFWKSKLKLNTLGWRNLFPWLAVLVIGGSIYGVLALRTVELEPNRVNFTFGQYYAYQYVQRHGLQSKYPNPWVQWLDIVRESMPELADPALISPTAAARRHPSEFAAHILFNIKTAARAVPAMTGGLIHPLLFLFCGAAFGSCYLLVPGRELPGSSARLDTNTRQYLIGWILAMESLISVGILMAPAARTLIPLIPAEMVLVGLIIGWVLNYAGTRKARTVRSSARKASSA